MNLNDRKELLAAIEGLAYAMKYDLRVDDRIKFGQHMEELIETLGDDTQAQRQLWAVKIDNKALTEANKVLRDCNIRDRHRAQCYEDKCRMLEGDQQRLRAVIAEGDDVIGALKDEATGLRILMQQDSRVREGLNSEIEQLSDTEDNLHQVCEDYDKHVVELDTEIRHLRTINSSMHERLAAHAADRLDMKYFKYKSPKHQLGNKWKGE